MKLKTLKRFIQILKKNAAELNETDVIALTSFVKDKNFTPEQIEEEVDKFVKAKKQYNADLVKMQPLFDKLGGK